MDNKYIRLNIFPIIIEGLFVLACLLFREHYIYINFLFYTVLAIYFWSRKAFFIREWLDSLKGGSAFWRQVILTIFFFGLAFIFTNILDNMFPHFNMGIINLKVDNWLKLILFTGSAIIFPPIVEEVFYRKNLISFRNRRTLILTALFSMFLYALEHTFAIWGIFLCMIWALPLSVAYIKTKNIYVPITAHFICNCVMNGITVVKICTLLLHWLSTQDNGIVETRWEPATLRQQRSLFYIITSVSAITLSTKNCFLVILVDSEQQSTNFFSPRFAKISTFVL